MEKVLYRAGALFLGLCVLGCGLGKRPLPDPEQPHVAGVRVCQAVQETPEGWHLLPLKGDKPYPCCFWLRLESLDGGGEIGLTLRDRAGKACWHRTLRYGEPGLYYPTVELYQEVPESPGENLWLELSLNGTLLYSAPANLPPASTGGPGRQGGFKK